MSVPDTVSGIQFFCQRRCGQTKLQWKQLPENGQADGPSSNNPRGSGAGLLLPASAGALWSGTSPNGWNVGLLCLGFPPWHFPVRHLSQFHRPFFTKPIHRQGAGSKFCQQRYRTVFADLSQEPYPSVLIPFTAAQVPPRTFCVRSPFLFKQPL